MCEWNFWESSGPEHILDSFSKAKNKQLLSSSSL